MDLQGEVKSIIVLATDHVTDHVTNHVTDNVTDHLTPFKVYSEIDVMGDNYAITGLEPDTSYSITLR